VVDERLKQSESANNFIVLSSQSEQDVEENDCTWITDSTIDIEIYNKTMSEVSKDVNDDIYEDVLEILLPTRLTLGISVGSDFQLLEGRRVTSITQNLSLSATESVLVTIVKLSFRFNQI